MTSRTLQLVAFPRTAFKLLEGWGSITCPSQGSGTLTTLSSQSQGGIGAQSSAPLSPSQRHPLNSEGRPQEQGGSSQVFSSRGHGEGSLHMEVRAFSMKKMAVPTVRATVPPPPNRPGVPSAAGTARPQGRLLAPQAGRTAMEDLGLTCKMQASQAPSTSNRSLCGPQSEPPHPMLSLQPVVP